MAPLNLFSSRSWQFWNSSEIRPKRQFEGLLLFGDLMFGGETTDALPPFLVSSFSRPGYSKLGTSRAEYQLRSGDYAQVYYPTSEFTTNILEVELVDANVFGSQGPDMAAHIHTALAMMQKTWVFEETAMAQEEGAPNEKYEGFVNAFIEGNPKIITILELDGHSGVLGEWTIYKPVLTRADFSRVAQTGGRFHDIRLAFDYKNFKYDQGWGNRELESRIRSATQLRREQIGNFTSNKSPNLKAPKATEPSATPLAQEKLA